MAKDRERRRRMKKHTVTLPLELIREILLRLPVRSVLRFKCVCKLWLSLISDPQFGISHYDLAASPIHRIILRYNDFYAKSFNIETPLRKFYSDVVFFLLPLPSRPCLGREGYYEDFRNQPEILGSCRGLILLYYRRSDDIILWNPTIGVHKRFTKTYFPFGMPDHFLYGFGYDASTDDYLLIHISLPVYDPETTIHIFSFKTESWNIDIDINFSYEKFSIEVEDKFKAGSLLNGALHWLVFSEENDAHVIIAFDMTQRSLSEIPLLDHLTVEEYELYGLRVMGGCLCVCCSVRGSETAEIWVMKEYKVESSWTKSTVIPTYDFSLICITKDGGIFGSKSTAATERYGSGRLEKLNDKGELLDYRHYGGGPGIYCVNLQSAMYRESLLPLPIVIQKTRKHEYNHGETSEDDHQETSEDDQQESSEDEQRISSEDDQQETSEDDQRESSEDDQQ